MSNRNQALDFTKGSLVLFMVVYHWLNYFVILDWDIYRYLRFLTPSFIMITGFLVSNIYLSKYAADDARLHRRLASRGLKLLLLFTALNLAVNVMLSGTYNGKQLGLSSFLSEAYPIYVTGGGRAAFDVLVPISYFLLLSPVVLLGSTVLRISLHAAGIGAVLLAAIAGMAGVHNVNLELLSIAIFGMGVGSLPDERVNAILRYPGALVMAYILYLAAITRWNVLFPLQVIGVSLTLLLIYLIGLRCGSSGIFQRVTIELGKYSLFAYIIHIVVLQLFRREFNLNGVELLMPFAATVIILILTVGLVVFARQKSGALDRLYRVVFA